jgi:hypothetical protein
LTHRFSSGRGGIEPGPEIRCSFDVWHGAGARLDRDPLSQSLIAGWRPVPRWSGDGHAQASALRSPCYTCLADPITGVGDYLNQTMFGGLQSDRSAGRHCGSPDNVIPLPVGHQMEVL